MTYRSSALKKQPVYYTPEEYLALEETATYKSEYCEGEIFAMAGGSAHHSRLAVRICTLLELGLEDTPCQVFNSDLKILVKEHDLYTYPDAMVVCGRPEFARGRTDTITNPLIIIEVLSKSTRHYDRHKKFELYQSLDSFEDYLLIDQTQVQVEYYHKLANGQWLKQEFDDLEAAVTLESIGLAIPLKQIYRNVDWLT